MRYTVSLDFVRTKVSLALCSHVVIDEERAFCITLKSPKGVFCVRPLDILSAVTRRRERDGRERDAKFNASRYGTCAIV
jgi:hypothetical protein